MARNSNVQPRPKGPAIATHEYTSKSSGAVLEVVSIADLLAHAGFTGFDPAKLMAFKVAELGAVVSIGKLSAPIKLTPPRNMALGKVVEDKNGIRWQLSTKGIFWRTKTAGSEWQRFEDGSAGPVNDEIDPPLPE